MHIKLPDTSGNLYNHVLSGIPVRASRLTADSPRIIYSAAHIVADPFGDYDPVGHAHVDWEKTMAFRRYLAGLGIGIAEAMDTAQRGNGLDWNGALELIRRTARELPDARIVYGCGTDHLDPSDANTLDDVRRAYLEQVEAIQETGGRLVLMASRALVRAARSAEDYALVYRDVLAACDEPVILHWLGPMFDPQLVGYWGSDLFEHALETCLAIISEHQTAIDGIKLSLLDAGKEVVMRRRLPAGVKMYTGDDFNYPELIQGDDQGHSHALLGIFDPLAEVAALAVNTLSDGDSKAFRAALDPTVPFARHLFRTPTQHYKTGVVFLAWLNGFQDHFIMLNGAQSARGLPYFVDCFRMADQCGLLRDPELAVRRMQHFLKLYGV